MQIRRLTAEDAAIFLELRLRALQESPTSFGSSYEEERDRTHMQVAEFLSGAAERAVMGAFDGDKLIGIVAVGRESAMKQRHIGFVRSMYVEVSSRGRRIGTALVDEALKVALGWPGIEQLTLAVNSSNTSAIALYSRAGFVEFGLHPHALCVHGAYHDELLMVRQSAA